MTFCDSSIVAALVEVASVCLGEAKSFGELSLVPDLGVLAQ